MFSLVCIYVMYCSVQVYVCALYVHASVNMHKCVHIRMCVSTVCVYIYIQYTYMYV